MWAGVLMPIHLYVPRVSHIVVDAPLIVLEWINEDQNKSENMTVIQFLEWCMSHEFKAVKIFKRTLLGQLSRENTGHWTSHSRIQRFTIFPPWGQVITNVHCWLLSWRQQWMSVIFVCPACTLVLSNNNSISICFSCSWLTVEVKANPSPTPGPEDGQLAQARPFEGSLPLDPCDWFRGTRWFKAGP